MRDIGSAQYKTQQYRRFLSPDSLLVANTHAPAQNYIFPHILGEKTSNKATASTDQPNTQPLLWVRSGARSFLHTDSLETFLSESYNISARLSQ
jgi:hypothetical protein